MEWLGSLARSYAMYVYQLEPRTLWLCMLAAIAICGVIGHNRHRFAGIYAIYALPVAVSAMANYSPDKMVSFTVFVIEVLLLGAASVGYAYGRLFKAEAWLCLTVATWCMGMLLFREAQRDTFAPLVISCIALMFSGFWLRALQNTRLVPDPEEYMGSASAKI